MDVSKRLRDIDGTIQQKTLDGKAFGSASQEFIDLNYIKHLYWWLVAYLLRRKTVACQTAWIENNQNLSAQFHVESCHAWYITIEKMCFSHQCGAFKNIVSLSLSLSLSLSTLMAIYSNHPSVRPFESTTGPPFRHSSGDFTTPILQCELSSLMSDLAGENHTGTTCMQIYHLIHMFLGIYMEIYIYV